MTGWSARTYIEEGQRLGVPDHILVAVADEVDRITIKAPTVAPVITLGHLGSETGCQYAWLRAVVSRSVFPYFTFDIEKKRGGRRVIHVPDRRLRIVQQWLNENVLQKLPVHDSAYAYFAGANIMTAARRHSGSDWMIKVDVKDFFPSISARHVYKVFRELCGYPALVSYELSRLCTVEQKYWRSDTEERGAMPYAASLSDGLPIGAPTSPMLSNLIMGNLDEKLAALARANFARYGRYADDLIFTSSARKFNRRNVSTILAATNKSLAYLGLTVNREKTVILPPGSAKMFLGLNVTGEEPRLPRSFKSGIREHYNFIHKFGAANHAKARRFASVGALERYLFGLISFAKQVEPGYGNTVLAAHRLLDWPLL